MNRMLLAAALLALFAVPATGQEITFTAETTTGDGTVTPVLTWSTSPTASSCEASGDWAGAKSPAGAETLAPITQSATYNLTCRWADDDVTVSWTPPTHNTDGSQYTDRKGFRVYYGRSPDALTETRFVEPDPPVRSVVIDDIEPGTWFFAVAAVNQRDAEGLRSEVVSAVVADETATRAVGITVNPIPDKPTDVRAE